MRLLPRDLERAVNRSTLVALLALAGLGPVNAATTRPGEATSEPPVEPFEPMGVLSGLITDDRGRPVDDAQIALMGPRHHRTRSEEDGFYFFEDVGEPGEYRIEIRSERCAGFTRYDEMPRVHLTSDSKMVKHFRLPRACIVEVKALDEEGDPVHGAELLVSSVGDRRGGDIARRITTDADGMARIGGLAPSETPYLVTALADELALTGATVTVQDPDKVTPLKIEMPRGVEVEGRAICSDGKPATGWEIQVRPSWWRSTRVPPEFEIDGEGAFTLEHIAPGDYSIHVSIPQGRGGMSFPVMETRLPPASGVLEVRVPRPSPGSTVSISGTIKYVGGEPKRGISITARGADNEHYWADVDSDERTFEIQHLPPGVYEVRFQSTEFKEKIVTNVKAPTEGLEVELEVTGKPVLAGKVVDAATGKPVRPFRVRARKLSTLSGPNYVQSDAWRLVDDENGAFSVETVGPGVYQVQVATDEYAWTLSREINTDTDKLDDIRVELKPGITLRGTVVDEAGKPISRAKVVPLSKAAGTMSRLLARFASDEGAVPVTDGRFELRNLAPGTESLKVTHPDYCFTIVDGIELAEGRTPDEVRAVLTPGGTVRGRVYDPDGKPEPSVTLYFQDASGYGGSGDEEAGRLATAVTNADGAYEVHHLPEQLCYINRGDPYRPRTGVLRHAVFPKNGLTRTLDIGGPPRISGRVIVNGQPLANTRVLIGGDSPHFGVFRALGMTDGSGSFAILGAPPGRRYLHYALPTQRSDWVQASIVEVGEKDIDLGTIDVDLGQVEVRIEAEGSETASDIRATLHHFNPKGYWGQSAGNALPRENADAPFVFDNVPVGRHEVSTYRSDYPSFRAPVELKPGESKAKVTVRIEYGTASVEAIGTGPEDNSFGILFLWNREKNCGTSLYLRSPGRYRAEHLPAGKWVVTNSYARDAEPIHEFSLAEGEHKTLDLAKILPGGGTASTGASGILRVTAVSDSGIPLPGTEMHLDGSAGRVEPGYMSDQMTIFTCPPGDYTLHVAYSGCQPVAKPVQVVTGDPMSNLRTEGLTIVEVRTVR